MQGETLAPLECSSLVDTIGKECIQEDKCLYLYRRSIGVPVLTFVDDCISVTKCGTDSVEMNAYLNAKTNIKKLQYGEKKCVNIHVGKNKEDCPELLLTPGKSSVLIMQQQVNMSWLIKLEENISCQMKPIRSI